MKENPDIKILRDRDASLSRVLSSKIGVIGYGNQGRAQALNLSDTGVEVKVGLRDQSPSCEKVVSDGLQYDSISNVAAWADIVVMLIPDDQMRSVYTSDVEPAIKPNSTLIFSHGYSIHYGLVQPKTDITVLLCAPSGPGRVLRDRFLQGSGLPGLIAVHQDPNKNGKALVLSYAKAIGMTRIGAVMSSFSEETETDLFGEQTVLTGGLPHLIRSSFRTLVDAGYQPVVAWLVSFYEVKMMVDLFTQTGFEKMDSLISSTAKFGGKTRGERLINENTRDEMRRILDEIKKGQFHMEYSNRVSKPSLITEKPDDVNKLFDQLTRQLLPIFVSNKDL